MAILHFFLVPLSLVKESFDFHPSNSITALLPGISPRVTHERGETREPQQPGAAFPVAHPPWPGLQKNIKKWGITSLRGDTTSLRGDTTSRYTAALPGLQFGLNPNPASHPDELPRCNYANFLLSLGVIMQTFFSPSLCNFPCEELSSRCHLLWQSLRRSHTSAALWACGRDCWC